MNIETARLIIRNFENKDAEALFAIKNDPAVLKYNPNFLGRNITLQDVSDYLERLLHLYSIGDIDTKKIYAITKKDTGDVIGAITMEKNKMLREYELGWKVRTEYTRQGYASEAAAAFCESFCEENGIDYIIVVMDTDNPASRRAAEKSGFRLFEKRKVYDHSYTNFGDDYYYFRRYYSKSTTQEKFYGDAVYTGRGAEAGDEKTIPKLIILRGNSGSGKTTIAKMLQQQLGRGTLYIPQDVVRREMLWVHDAPHNKAISLLSELLKYGHMNCEYTILEGILYSPDYQDVFHTAIENYGKWIYAYRFHIPFEETLKRHQTKPNCNEFGEKEMREWYIEKDDIGIIPENEITSEESAAQIVQRILEDIRR